MTDLPKRNRKTPVKLSVVESTELFAKLAEVLVLPPGYKPYKSDDHAVVSYIDGYDDERVAKEVGGRVNKTHVNGMRNSYYGPLYYRDEPRTPASASGNRRFGDQIAELRDRITRLETELDDLRAALGGG